MMTTTTYKVKIFRGTAAEVEIKMNAWLATTNVVDIHKLTQTEASMNTLTVTVLYSDGESQEGEGDDNNN